MMKSKLVLMMVVGLMLIACAAVTAEPLVYEAEDAYGYKAIWENKNAGFQGEAYVNYDPNEPGGYIVFIAKVPEDGDYYLEFAFANGAADDRPADIIINGEMAVEQLSFVSTGDWTTWLLTGADVTLKEGLNVIKVLATGPSGGANIDYLKVYAADEKPAE